jgi:hypothetical protein
MKQLFEWIKDELQPLLWVIVKGDIRRCQIKISLNPRLEIYIPYHQREAYWESNLEKLIADRRKKLENQQSNQELDEIPF